MKIRSQIAKMIRSNQSHDAYRVSVTHFRVYSMKEVAITVADACSVTTSDTHTHNTQYTTHTHKHYLRRSIDDEFYKILTFYITYECIFVEIKHVICNVSVFLREVAPFERSIERSTKNLC